VTLRAYSCCRQDPRLEPSRQPARQLLARTLGPEQRLRWGDKEVGGYSCSCTDDFARDYATFQARGVQFVEAPREEGYGTVAVFEDFMATAGT
jgi:hypothetical protein